MSAEYQTDTFWSLLWSTISALITVACAISALVFFFMAMHNWHIGNNQRAILLLLLSISFELGTLAKK